MNVAYSWDETEVAENGEGVAAAGELPAATELEDPTIFTIPTLKPLWEAQAVINPGRDKVAHIAIDEEVVFVQSTAGVVTAMNAESGRQFWASQVGRNDEVAMKGSTDSQMVVIVVGPVIHAFDKFSGNKLFSFRLPHQSTSAPLLTRREVTIGSRVDVTRNIFVPTSDRSVVAYDVENLQYLGRRGTLKPGVALAQDWRFVSGEIVRFAPVAGQDRLAFATEVGNLHVLDIAGSDKGKSQFQFLMNSPTTAPLTVVTREDNEYLLAACENNRLFCIAMKTDGTMVWTIPMSRPVYEPIAVVGNDVFVLADDGSLQKFNLRTGEPVKVSEGSVAMASQTEGASGLLPAYGAAVELRCEGSLAFHPIQIANRSTGQMINSVVLDFSKSLQGISFAADDENLPKIRVSDRSRQQTGMKTATLSDDRKSLTIEFTDFHPEEVFEVFVDMEHPDTPSFKLSHKELVGGNVRAMVSPVRATVVASAASNRKVEPYPPRTVIGRFSEVTTPWQVMGAKSLVAISKQAVYFVDINDRVVAVSREHAGSPVVTPTREYTIHINNSLTDRVFLSTAFGRVACFAEERLKVGALAIPAPGGLSWLVYPESELSPDFAEYHQHPRNRPIMPDVPKTDPAAPATEGGEADEMP
jgi:outer membrane protein assembly factor BamB